jgi:hypothetical protein
VRLRLLEELSMVILRLSEEHRNHKHRDLRVDVGALLSVLTMHRMGLL